MRYNRSRSIHKATPNSKSKRTKVYSRRESQASISNTFFADRPRAKIRGRSGLMGETNKRDTVSQSSRSSRKAKHPGGIRMQTQVNNSRQMPKQTRDSASPEHSYEHRSYCK